jgi:hypothetical protein
MRHGSGTFTVRGGEGTDGNDWRRSRAAAGSEAARLRDEAGKADEPLRQGKIDEARELVTRNAAYARAIWHELDLLTRPPREIPIKGKSRGR